MRRGSILLAAVCVAAAAAPAVSAKPPLKNACKLVTDGEIKTLMGRRPIARRGGGPEGCVWTTRRRSGSPEQGATAEEAGLVLTGFKDVAQAKEYARQRTESVGCAWDPLLPQRSLGNEAWVEDCSADVTFRLGRIVGGVTTFTFDVAEGSRADVRRTVGLTKKAVPRLRRYRCAPPLCPG
jgi:hypothetical protein